MSFFDFNFRTKSVVLDFTQVRFANVVVQMAAVFIRHKSNTHKSLALKIERAKNVVRGGEAVTLEFTEPEKRLMREYNSNYCGILSDRMKLHDKEASVPDYPALEAYELSTQIQLLFSSIR
ncbi:hypothetical protein LZD49_12575 [Dyadobacter sp. CY261]|uniref:hypothetical protein n=1 Tax=Dyadobacter sp. CY261 TaxID=2907203 RepID=UPI001F2D3B30|nr:hypothetical protein [Dyadobacter sp. CY261]MCF0071308.1 hypothetical protein [Dyadobacter sp. CY261]